MPIPRTPIVLAIVITTGPQGTLTSVTAECEGWDDSPETRDCLEDLRPLVTAYATETARAVARAVSGHEVGEGVVLSNHPTYRRAGRA